MKVFRKVSSDVVWPFQNRFCQNRINKFGQIQPKCLRNYAWKMMMWHIVWSKKTGKAKLWRSIWLVMKVFRTVSSDVVWPFKNLFCQNRINKIDQIQPKYLRNYAWLMMMWHIVWSKKTGKAKLWRSICLVMKIFRTVSSDVVWPFKNRFCQNRSKKKAAKISKNA